MDKEQQIVKVVTRRDLHEADNGDCDYWRKQKPEDRIAALEQIRSEYHQWRYGAEPRLQRVYTIVKRK